MATWDQVVRFVGTQFPIAVEGDTSFRIDVAWDNGRSHLLGADRIDVDPPTVWITSPICPTDRATEADVMTAMARLECPIGVVKLDAVYVLSHIMEIDTIDTGELARFIAWMAELADGLELELTGGDGYHANIAPDPGGPVAGGGGFCTGCGAPRVAGAAFCSNCGSRLG